jgi:hypothetical protein
MNYTDRLIQFHQTDEEWILLGRFAYSVLANLNPSMIQKPDFGDNSINFAYFCFLVLK